MQRWKRNIIIAGAFILHLLFEISTWRPLTILQAPAITKKALLLT